ncbi:MAG TPA: type II secretion system F family protein [Planctomycetota bacterium]|nr:type II secretion system F family protein [Planctomycetota bacterium]
MEFEYTARTSTGERVTGLIQAENENAALRVLESRALFPVDVRDAEKARGGITVGRQRISSRDLGVFYGQLADLLRSGVPLLRALVSLERAALSKRQRQLVRDLHDAVERGSSLTDAMRAHDTVFPALHVAMVQAGERASFLEEVLQNLSSFVERIDDLRGRVRGALIYPALLSLLGSVIMIAALVFFVPRFEPLLQRVDKPLPTVLIFAASEVVREHWFLLLGGVAIAIGLAATTLRAERARNFLEAVRLRIPVVGSAVRMVAIARFCRILGTLLANGVPMLQALAISKDATGSRLLASRIAEATENVRAGDSLAKPLGEGGFLPPQILAMISVAEESNQLERVLVHIADTVERRTQRQVDEAVRLIEPVVLCLVAAAIGFLALGLLLPIFTLAGSLGAR